MVCTNGNTFLVYKLLGYTIVSLDFIQHVVFVNLATKIVDLPIMVFSYFFLFDNHLVKFNFGNSSS